MRKRGTFSPIYRIVISAISFIVLIGTIHLIARLMWIAVPEHIANTGSDTERNLATYSTDAAGFIMTHGLTLIPVVFVIYVVYIMTETMPALILKIKQLRRVTLRSTYVPGKADTKELRVSERQSTNAHLN